jgi:RNA polymerase sigma-70 factor (family 1)
MINPMPKDQEPFSEDDLLKQFREGDVIAFESIFDNNYTYILYSVKKLISACDEAEDIATETFVKLWNRKSSFLSLQHIQAFLYVTARNSSLDYLKKKTKGDQKFKEWQSLQEDNESFLAKKDNLQLEAEIIEKISQEIKKLPKKQRMIFEMFYQEGLSIKEIAIRLKCEVKTVLNQKNTALKRLNKNCKWIILILVQVTLQ